MRKLIWLFCLLFGGCASPHPNNEPAEITPQQITPPAPTTAENPAPVLVKPPSKPQPRLALKYFNTTRDGIRMYVVAFDDRDYALQVADQPRGVGSLWATAQEAASAKGAVAAVNGGFFTPEGKPLGLLVEAGTKRGKVNKSSLGSGIYLSSHAGSSIMRRETYLRNAIHLNPQHLLQVGPMLAEQNKAVSKLLKSNLRPRSFLAWDGRHHWLIGCTEPCSLGALSKALAGRTPGGFVISDAVNLDGGRSSDLWVGKTVPGGGKSHRGIFNKAVRNYLVLVPRKP